ncbi:hypothetical protein I4F81_002214 [Pyropia yezoensis]|uniref:Uncharacterized protein n=1 Tax=Pyropia yezoensis TaxID=2788 RepID=A0ACC3BNR7_PYRYE|nr:hypothetical protein I4F81_002214 [Neopyropia yezoensis]
MALRRGHGRLRQRAALLRCAWPSPPELAATLPLQDDMLRCGCTPPPPQAPPRPPPPPPHRPIVSSCPAGTHIRFVDWVPSDHRTCTDSTMAAEPRPKCTTDSWLWWLDAPAGPTRRRRVTPPALTVTTAPAAAAERDQLRRTRMASQWPARRPRRGHPPPRPRTPRAQPLHQGRTLQYSRHGPACARSSRCPYPTSTSTRPSPSPSNAWPASPVA